MHCVSIVLSLRAGGYEFSHIFSRFASTSNGSNASTIIVLFTQSISYRVVRGSVKFTKKNLQGYKATINSELLTDYRSCIDKKRYTSLRTQPIAASSRSTIWSGGNGLRWVPPS